MAIRTIKGIKTISFEAAVLLSGLTPITLKAKERALTYAVKHPEHYLNYTPINDKHTSKGGRIGGDDGDLSPPLFDTD